MASSKDYQAPKWEGKVPSPRKKEAVLKEAPPNANSDGYHSISDRLAAFPPLDGPSAVNYGDYQRTNVTNVDSSPPPPPLDTTKRQKRTNAHTQSVVTAGRAYFDLGLRHMLGYQHEMAAKYFMACLSVSPYCALAHGLIALCHAPNYNFKGVAYYNSTNHPPEPSSDSENKGAVAVASYNSDPPITTGSDSDSPSIANSYGFFPSQQIAERHSRLAIGIVEDLRKLRGSEQQDIAGSSSNKLHPTVISDVESSLLVAIRILTRHIGIDANQSNDIVGRPFVNAMRHIYQKNSEDVDVAYFFVEALMVIHAWHLYEYPTGKALSPDVHEIRTILEKALAKHDDTTTHAGVCHMYVHLCEMSSNPGQALMNACEPLRHKFPNAGHLIHMPTHIDVLVGDYDSVVDYNSRAILADAQSRKQSPETAGPLSFYFGYIVHNYHMLVYGCILGAMEDKGMVVAQELNSLLSESMFIENRDLTVYLEAYSALDIHIFVRFGRWEKILQLKPPKHKKVMLYRAATLHFARAPAHANLGNLELAKKEADQFDLLQKDPEASNRILHNNQVSDVLGVDAPMIRGEIAYKEGNHEEAFRLLRKAVELRDGLNYDEPWGKMQPIRHALGGLLLEQNLVEESEQVFRTDLQFHPKNPWGLVGLISCLQRRLTTKVNITEANMTALAPTDDPAALASEIKRLQKVLDTQRKSKYADYNVTVACSCCQATEEEHP